MNLSPDDALAELCRRSFFRFVKEFWFEIIPETPVWNWHIEYICNELQTLNEYVVKREAKPYDLIINIPPGSSKSTIATQMYNAWVWTIDPTQRFITSSYAKSLSLTHSIKTRDIITSDKYNRLFPEVVLKQDEQSKSDFKLTSGGQRFTTSTGSSVTGMHGHQIVVDDPIDPTQASSDADRKSANDFVHSTLSTRKIDKSVTPMILIMQRLHEDDPTGTMIKKRKNIKHICLPAEDSNNVKPIELRKHYKNGLLDPVRLNRNAIAESRIDLGTYKFSGQFGQLPTPQEGGIFKRKWFELIPWEFKHDKLVWEFAADTAYTKKESNDPYGAIAYAYDDGDFIIRFAETEHLEYPDLCRRLESFPMAHGYTRRSLIEIEPKASGKSSVQSLKKETSLNITESRVPTKDKVARANDASPTCEAGRVKLIIGAWNKEFLDQVCTFPNATHDEYVDCLTMMVNKPNRNRRSGVKRKN